MWNRCGRWQPAGIFSVGDLTSRWKRPVRITTALIKIGDTSYLICNNTAKTMKEIRGDARWLKAQAGVFRTERKNFAPIRWCRTSIRFGHEKAQKFFSSGNILSRGP